MIPDLDAVHTWNGFDINNVWASTGVPRFPRVRLDPSSGLSGFHGLPEGADRRDALVGRRYREVPRASFRGVKPIVYSGWLEAQTEADLDALEDSMTRAFADMGEGTMVITQFGTGTQYMYKATCEALNIDGNLPATRDDLTYGHKRNFTLGMRMTDGRFYSNTEQTVVASAPSDAGSLSVPLTVPFTLTPSGTQDVSGGLSFDAGAGSDPVVTFFGPVTNPTLYNVTQNRRLVFAVDIPAGTPAVVDFAARTVLIDGVDATDYAIDDEASDYWDAGVQGLAPGVNKVVLYPANNSTLSMKVRKSYLG